MDINLSIILLGIVILVIGLAGNLLMPVYLPYYHYIDSLLIKNSVNVKVNPLSTVKVLKVTTNESDNTIYVVTNNTNVNVFVYYTNLTLLANQSGYIAVKVNPGSYIIAINNPTDVTQLVELHYAVVPSYELSDLFTYSSIVSTVTELLIAFGIVIAGIGIIRALFKGRVGTKIDRFIQRARRTS